jgi:hypothetical protein
MVRGARETPFALGAKAEVLAAIDAKVATARPLRRIFTNKIIYKRSAERCSFTERGS